MTCPTNQLDAFVDGELSPAALAAVEAHLQTCPACSAHALAQMQLKNSVRAAADAYQPSPEFRARIAAQVATKQRRPLHFWLSPALALVAAVVLVAISVPLIARHYAHERALSELLDLHVSTLASANPVDVVSTDRHTVKPWFQGKLPFTFNLPDLTYSPYTLLGGKLIFFNHAPEAQLLFSFRQHRISVFVLKSATSSRDGVQTEDGFTTESWTAGGLHCIVVSDASAADVHALADLMRSAQAK
ncbi:anti-sigma factor family protein [Occallatibacter riparius]|uniref:Anti-sigma factor n=1 Tax=Occallatibacter riparius TaxID=1002689 RepID=A0A9J7BQE9_9BACT|nr:anti-sigma factor [Occallatibacter riparius]UWZ83970.1 anti-sigma factor [Occallatibacter riparius]